MSIVPLRIAPVPFAPRRVAAIVSFVACLASPALAQPPSYDDLMRRANELTAPIRNGEQPSDPVIEEELRGILTEAFERRQDEQRAEIMAIREELDAAENRLQEREEHKQAIIERKLQQLIRDQETTEWPKKGSEEIRQQLAFDVIAANDTVAVYILGVLPFTDPSKVSPPPPITTLPSGHVVSGFPLVVASDGTIRLPMIDPVKIAGLTVREAEQRINSAYHAKSILRSDRNPTILTLVPSETRTEDAAEPSTSPDRGAGSAFQDPSDKSLDVTPSK